ncbi:Flavin-dependent oxidoreductase, luciferase family (includes alkanesulfonate monooxygenase SsuD and methylene tetrahydromethanopterin reductase) [Streptomyces zhaozhouensis]|uniref:Flavin-dependent oxidoreductase, luciferase family (Includes alkanesulfonate monooxygenase SsuD and methylene tetrahydromethanopterin reductase) n=1 Tax=Streptomyces zhaozhouensis TaxID=1300267 RepID=A0A286E1R9_9ACTN|nr:LLM class flavin-dependent oxidoreductase [Streptomyces zhaozhouensis]SOD64858.1 Flavin-dependent oxidoreductase, luciferase family (includes alkanesulfonate monooxygenase SsuD and methylene tetrahydromethanopterin reductase) [Streptomyces zhaozhouensis]
MAAPEVGVFLPTMTEHGEALPDVAAAARHAEALGLESVWAVDQLVGGTGVPLLESTVALTAAAAVTSRVRLGFGVYVLPLRPAVWTAKQVASLQRVSGDRVLLGVGVGGDRHAASWAAAGVPSRERGRRTDAALAVLPDLIAGRPAEVDGGKVRLAPGAVVPPVIVGGMAPAALARAAAHGDGWFAMPVPDARLAEDTARLAELAAARGRPAPEVTGTVLASIEGDPARPDREGLVRRLTDPDGMFGMPGAAVDAVVTGGPAALAERVDAVHRAGARRVVLSVAAGDWYRQTELLAEAVALL